jgi:hypothetical protein
MMYKSINQYGDNLDDIGFYMIASATTISQLLKHPT